MLDKNYDAAKVEPRIYEAWEKEGAFRAGAGAAPGAETFAIVIPPPNVTGSLHMGHALNNTLQDILIRFERMRGKDVLWQVGLDHAGIATQMVVERQMAERQEPNRRVIGREAFVDKVWKWKAESGGTIIGQLKRLGASADWSRERFTMDEGLSKAVLKVFVELYRQGLIYKDKRLVNWDPALETAISDLEVIQVETKGKLYHFRYPIEGKTFDPDDATTFITVATTRPETMLGDTAVAVHPEDERYQAFVAAKAHAILPLVGRRIPIVADEYSDPEKGSGAVKITPAHDFNDFEVGKRHKLPMISVLDRQANIAIAGNADFLAGVPATAALADLVSAVDGLDRFTARNSIVAMMEEQGYLDKIEDHGHTVPHGDRGGVPIEPFLTEQWYVDAHTLAQPAIASVREGRTDFVPKNWEKTYFEWMNNIQPWCISRQLWWGHQIPAWYGPDGTIFVAYDESEAQVEALQHYRSLYPNLERVSTDGTLSSAAPVGSPADILEIALRRDEDVLDTWFSSALWPFSTLGWPEATPELARYYPTQVLITGFDIIFFWVARMMMMGLHFMKDAEGKPIEPFKDVYIHALVRDEKGAKMSKSKGNVIDPLGLIDEYGADALRFTLTAMAAQGRDIKLATSRVEGYRNFATKLWNAARFAEMNGAVRVDGFEPSAAREKLNRWIATETTRTANAVTEAIIAYRFNDAANALYRFVWNNFCDWYLELVKPVLNGEDEAAKAETRATIAWTLDRIVTLLHPIMPFITEELWARTGETGPARSQPLILTAWPELTFEDSDAAAEINWLVELISTVRSVRSEINVPPGAQVPLVIVGASSVTAERLATHDTLIRRLARASDITAADAPPKGAVQAVLGESTIALPLEGVIDLAAERARLGKELDKAAKEIAKIEAKLGNEQFVSRAPEEVIEEQRDRLAEASELKAKFEAALERLKG
ncbi:valine--tRNA ligase [Kaistia dalseonensis]|uniref:Valine--tRNA ligase n=1 Tax=Kaistia dalseonensis TaxID=410840 RepID=A0ABU0H270_9HYPH|nr:valine--tRNA ligase [Kaistia dalseonensis]MCX5493838.1 valine--tRNA ligase [Kaistia dalseonensis]MDQ0436403.1 valyl-tRNA synthetase [Kaistia dalseonensis]